MEVEGSGVAHSEENKDLPEKKMRRRFKTPSQLQGLEDFYNEHKYPTESMKAELAEKLGLTEKQVSGWFCHRRLKDKRLSTGRQDLSSGVIQDRGSGLRQDSCGSTKQGEHVIPDLKEVESRRLSGEDRLALGQNYELKRHYDIVAKDDTSSESDSDLNENAYPQSRDLMDVEIAEYVPPNEIISRSRGRMGPSGYLKIKGQTENAAITAVKRQLGRHYKEDGPPLGVEFDALPPGAFESPPVKATPYQAYRGTEQVSSGSVDLHRQPGSNMVRNLDPFVEPTDMRPLTGSEKENKACRYPPKQKPSMPDHENPFLGKKSPSVVGEYPVTESSVFNGNIRHNSKSKHGPQGVRPVGFSDPRFRPSGGRIGSELPKPVMHQYGDVKPKVFRKRELEAKPSILTAAPKDSFHSGARLLSNKMAEDEDLYEEIRATRDNHDSIRAKMRPTNEPRVYNRGRDGLLQLGYTTKSPLHNLPPFPKQMRGSAAEVPSSFSEDETADTSSSVD